LAGWLPCAGANVLFGLLNETESQHKVAIIKGASNQRLVPEVLGEGECHIKAIDYSTEGLHMILAVFSFRKQAYKSKRQRESYGALQSSSQLAFDILFCLEA